MKKALIVLIGAISALFFASMAHATTFPTLNGAVAVCDPNFPTNCLSPSSGGIPTTSTTNAPVAPGAGTATNSNLIGCRFVAAGVTFTDGQQGAISCDAAGNVEVNTVGNVASGATDSGSPVKVGGVFNSTLPTVTTGQRVDAQFGSRGGLNVNVYGANTNAGVSAGAPADAQAATNGLYSNVFNFGYNGATFDRLRTVVGAVTAGTGTMAVALVPTSASTGAITPVVSAAAEGSHVLKGSAGNLYSLVVTSGASAGYVMVFNATSAPADGAVTPIECVVIAANSTVSLNYSGPPEAFATGITAVFSTTGCFTKTISVTAFFSGKVS